MEASTLRFVVSTVLMRFVGNEQISVLGLNMSGGAQRPALCHQEFNVAQIYILKNNFSNLSRDRR